MIFAVTMDVDLPSDMDAATKADIWRHIWRIAGQYSNLSIFDVADNDELHAILWQLPLFAFMRIVVTPLATHPSAITEGANG